MTSERAQVCFVTGGSGFVGRNLIRTMVGHGIHVRALARSEASSNVVSALGASPVCGDLLNSDSLRKGMTGADILVHAAADTNHGTATQVQERANLDGSQLIYQTAQECHVRRAIHLSTEAVLLTGKPLIDADETMPLPKKFAGGYSKTKAAAETIALEHSCENLAVIVIRPRFVWGRDDTTALPQLIAAAGSGKLAWIGGGRYKISTTHIANLCSAVLLAIRNGRAGEIYFVTDGPPVEFRGFITQMLATRNIDAPTREVPRFVVKWAVRAGEMLSRLSCGAIAGPMSWQEYATLGDTVTLNIDKARKELGYRPIITVDDGLEELRRAHARSASHE